MGPKLAIAACIPALLAACSSPADSVSAKEKTRSRAQWPLPAEPADPAPNAASVATAAEPTENTTEPAGNAVAASDTTPAPAQALAARDPASFRATGTEPFWSVKIFGGTLVLEAPGKPARYFSVTDASSGGNRRYAGSGIQLTATPGPCSDGMSDRSYGERVQLSTPDGVMKGCGMARTAR
jgi:uncharacterized membrane protein